MSFAIYTLPKSLLMAMASRSSGKFQRPGLGAISTGRCNLQRPVEITG